MDRQIIPKSMAVIDEKKQNPNKQNPQTGNINQCTLAEVNNNNSRTLKFKPLFVRLSPV